MNRAISFHMRNFCYLDSQEITHMEADCPIHVPSSFQSSFGSSYLSNEYTYSGH